MEKHGKSGPEGPLPTMGRHELGHWPAHRRVQQLRLTACRLAVLTPSFPAEVQQQSVDQYCAVEQEHLLGSEQRSWSCHQLAQPRVESHVLPGCWQSCAVQRHDVQTLASHFDRCCWSGMCCLCCRWQLVRQFHCSVHGMSS